MRVCVCVYNSKVDTNTIESSGSRYYNSSSRNWVQKKKSANAEDSLQSERPFFLFLFLVCVCTFE